MHQLCTDIQEDGWRSGAGISVQLRLSTPNINGFRHCGILSFPLRLSLVRLHDCTENWANRLHARALMDHHNPSITLPIPHSCPNLFPIAISRTQYNKSMIKQLLSRNVIEYRTLASISHCSHSTF